MRYYQELSKRRKDQCRYLGTQLKKKAAKDKVVNESHDRYARSDYMRNVTAELKKTRLFLFADKVDAMYESKYKLVYSNCVPMQNTITSQADISVMYEAFRRDFPHNHALFSIIFSKENNQIQIDTSFETGRAQDSESDDSFDENDDNTDDDNNDISIL